MRRTGQGVALFDGYVAVDWSANGSPKRGPDSIWLATSGWGATAEPENPATRTEAVDRIEGLLARATEAGRRLLLGFDFPFGYPAGTARRLTGRDGWEAVWSRIAELVEDGPDNANNRFDAAAALNAAFAGDGPFWGNGLKRDIPGLPRRKPAGWGANLPSATGATPSPRSGARRRSGSSSGRVRWAGRRLPGSRHSKGSVAGRGR